MKTVQRNTLDEVHMCASNSSRNVGTCDLGLRNRSLQRAQWEGTKTGMKKEGSIEEQR